MRTSYQIQHYYFQKACLYHGTKLITLFWSYRVALTNSGLLELPEIWVRWKTSPGENNLNSELYKYVGNSFYERLLLFLIKCLQCDKCWKMQKQYCRAYVQERWQKDWKISLLNPYPTAFPYGNGMVLHFYQQQESSTTKTVHKVINKGLKTYV